MYVLRKGEEFNKEESKTVEFKAHDRLALTQMTNREIDGHLFQPASRTLCAFLNINKECDLYLGIKDDGTVMGHPMFSAQIDHFIQSLDVLMKKKFDPPVDKYRYEYNFIKVLEDGEENCNPKSTGQGLTLKQDHQLLDQPKLCWCEKEIADQKRLNKTAPLYVIHVRINQWERSKDSHGYSIWPYFSSEEKKSFIRYNASNHELGASEVIDQTRLDLREGLI